jgi:FAD:protein FMN transferase
LNFFRKFTVPRAVALFLLLSLLAAICIRLLSGDVPMEEVRRRTPVLGTFATYIVVAEEGCGQTALNSMDSLARHLDTELGVFGSGEVSSINARGLAILSQTSSDFRRLLEISLFAASVTDSLFDPVMGRLVRTWGFPESPALPDSHDLYDALAHTGLKGLHISGDTLRLEPGFLLDFGAVAKGYACDRIYELAIARGAGAALVEIGGEIRCGGSGELNRIWRLAIRDPRGDGTMELLEMERGALATSGDYESYFMHQGRRFCHILDPRTGYPQEVTASVTVSSEDAAMGDALATAISVGGIPLASTIPDSLFDLIIIVYETEEGGTVQWRRTGLTEEEGE